MPHHVLLMLPCLSRNMDVPFVSEDFQRAFRNQFPAQMSTGRDLHVSDVVIPVVDFTPTSSGASLPQSLQQCRNFNTEITEVSTTVSYTDVITTPGFWNVVVFLSQANANGVYRHRINGTAGSTVISNLNYTSAGEAELKDSFICFIPAGYTLQYEFNETTGSGNGRTVYTQLADVNGNLTQPFNYSPQ